MNTDIRTDYLCLVPESSNLMILSALTGHYNMTGSRWLARPYTLPQGRLRGTSPKHDIDSTVTSAHVDVLSELDMPHLWWYHRMLVHIDPAAPLPADGMVR